MLQEILFSHLDEMNKKLRGTIEKITMLKKYYRWLAKKRLIKRYGYLIEVNTIMEEYTTSKLLKGGSDDYLKKGRDDLLKIQAELRENANFVKFLKTL